MCLACGMFGFDFAGLTSGLGGEIDDLAMIVQQSDPSYILEPRIVGVVFDGIMDEGLTFVPVYHRGLSHNLVCGWRERE